MQYARRWECVYSMQPVDLQQAAPHSGDVLNLLIVVTLICLVVHPYYCCIAENGHNLWSCTPYLKQSDDRDSPQFANPFCGICKKMMFRSLSSCVRSFLNSPLDHFRYRCAKFGVFKPSGLGCALIASQSDTQIVTMYLVFCKRHDGGLNQLLLRLQPIYSYLDDPYLNRGMLTQEGSSILWRFA
ncbi:hypothetical protein evm_005638 [Chilo suppressalis]|nr:hypothetical protein evm_005638 [Chilo suppressalis]